MIGGRLLGQGTYGCIFSPPLMCDKGLKGKKVVGKVSRIEDLKPELDAAVILKKGVNNWDDYFLLPAGKGLCDPPEVQREPDLEKCEIIRKFGLDNLKQITMPFGGKDVYQRLLTVKLIPTKFNLFAFTQHLLEAGALMVLNGFVHFDIHSGNVLLDSKYTPRLIDYGESFTFRQINDDFVNTHWKVFDPSFGPEPPELTVATAVRKGEPFLEVLRQVLEEKESITKAEGLLSLSKMEQGRQFRAFWETSRSAQEKDWVSFWKTYWPMFDSWAIGTLVLTLLRRILITGGSLDSNKLTNLESVLSKMMHMSPRERFDCVEALSMLDPLNNVLQSEKAEKWLRKRRAERTGTAAAAAAKN